MGASGRADHRGSGQAERAIHSGHRRRGLRTGCRACAFKLAGQPVAGDCRVTNIYRRESGAWKFVHHHTDIAQAMVDLLSRMKK
ncbi:MAG: nuclear transport factor 2 family protein [Steroidobacterales bacterium]